MSAYFSCFKGLTSIRASFSKFTEINVAEVQNFETLKQSSVTNNSVKTLMLLSDTTDLFL